jgi:hypothetical protein
MKTNALIEQKINAMPICSDGKAKLTDLVNLIIGYMPTPRLTKTQKSALQAVEKQKADKVKAEKAAKAKEARANAAMYRNPKFPIGSVVTIGGTHCLVTKRGNIILDSTPYSGSFSFRRVQTEEHVKATEFKTLASFLRKHKKSPEWLKTLDDLRKEHANG